jgi:hypothetical protein
MEFLARRSILQEPADHGIFVTRRTRANGEFPSRALHAAPPESVMKLPQHIPQLSRMVQQPQPPSEPLQKPVSARTSGDCKPIDRSIAGLRVDATEVTMTSRDIRSRSRRRWLTRRRGDFTVVKAHRFGILQCRQGVLWHPSFASCGCQGSQCTADDGRGTKCNLTHCSTATANSLLAAQPFATVLLLASGRRVSTNTRATIFK